MVTHLTTIEDVKGVKHPLILSPRIDTKRYNPTTITHKTSQACAQPLTKAMHKSPQDVCELGCSQDAGAWVPETHTRVRHPPTTRTRHRAHSAHGRLAPTSPPSAGGARGRRRRRIPSVAAADEAPAKVERPHLKGTVSGRKAQVRVLQRSHGSAREAREALAEPRPASRLEDAPARTGARRPVGQLPGKLGARRGRSVEARARRNAPPAPHGTLSRGRRAHVWVQRWRVGERIIRAGCRRWTGFHWLSWRLLSHAPYTTTALRAASSARRSSASPAMRTRAREVTASSHTAAEDPRDGHCLIRLRARRQGAPRSDLRQRPWAKNLDDSAGHRVEEALPPGGTSAPQICNLDCQYPNLISNHPIREPSNPPSGETVPVIAELVLNQNQPSLSQGVVLLA